MSKNIELIGVQTNNLKNIDVVIPHGSIFCIAGVSGGGKSSLAYDTLHSLCHQEFRSIDEGYFEDAKYKVRIFNGIIPSVAIKQNNSNVNPRSTLYTYLNFYSLLSSAKNSQPINFDRFKINRPENECETCGGLGVEKIIDINKIVDSMCPLSENPFVPWRSKTSNKDFKILEEFCINNKIDMNLNFEGLSKKNKDLLLYSDDGIGLSIKFKYNGRYRKKTISYVGIMQEMTAFLFSGKRSEINSVEKYCKSEICSACSGARIKTKIYSDIYIFNMYLKDFLSWDVDSIIRKFSEFVYEDAASVRVFKVLKTISDLGLGYLTLTRSIPSLSGGELQKLNFCKLLNSDISSILTVIDEISSQVHVSDYAKIFNEIINIKNRGNTVVLVEHNSYFIRRSDKVLVIGPKSGNDGGQIVKSENFNFYFPSEKMYFAPQSFFKPKSLWKNNVLGLDIKIPTGMISALCGKSGSGKSSVAEALSEIIDDVIYISQDSIKGNIRSSVASYLEINSIVAEYYAGNLSQEYDLFFPSSGKAGACEVCSGAGVIQQSRSYDTSIEVTCHECGGKLFSKKANGYLIEGKSISDLYDESFSQILLGDLKFSNKFESILKIAESLGLGHLSMNRKTNSLSGGELKRIKLLKGMSKRSLNKILIIDEPGSGLDDKTCAMVMKYMQKNKKNYRSIIVIDHKPSVFMLADYIIEMGPGAGSAGGKIVFEGDPNAYYNENYKKFLS